jgi:hypothetical protein
MWPKYVQALALCTADVVERRPERVPQGGLIADTSPFGDVEKLFVVLTEPIGHRRGVGR